MKNGLCIALIILVCIASAGCTSKNCAPAATPIATSNSNQKVIIHPTSTTGTVYYSIQFTAKTTPEAPVTWSASSGIINSDGFFTPMKTGEVYVTATAGGVSSTAVVIVEKKSQQRNHYSNNDRRRDWNWGYYNNNHDRNCDQSQHSHRVEC